MARLNPAQITQALNAVEQLIVDYERSVGDGLVSIHDPDFRRYLNEEVAPTMQSDERARYEGYLRTYCQVQLGQSADRAPTIRPPTATDADLSPVTAARYARKAEGIIAAFERETGESFEPQSEQFAQYVGERLAGLSASSRRAYQAALDYHYRASLGIEAGAPRFRDWMPDAARQSPPPKPPVREKGIKPADARKLITVLHRTNTFHGGVAALTLEAGILTGLRPVEWARAEIIGVELEGRERPAPALRVINAKQSHNRAHSPTRTLILDEMDMREYKIIEQTIWQWHAYIQAAVALNAEPSNEADMSRAVGAIINAAGVAITKATRRLGLKPYTLYAARHQFAANAKAAGCTRIEVAAMMGHASVETAGEHYGKRRRGAGGGLKVRPSSQDIAAVAAKNPQAIDEPVKAPRTRPKKGDDLSM
jgi:integrase